MIMEKIEILIESLFDSKGFIEAKNQIDVLSSLAEKLNVPFEQATKTMKGFSKSGLDIRDVGSQIKLFNEDSRFIQDFSDKFGVTMQQAKIGASQFETLQKAMRKYNLQLIPTAEGGWKVADSLTGVGVTGKEAFERMLRNTNRFKMYLLSIMFFGMQLQRTFGGFLKTAIDGYMKLTNAQTPTGKAILRMNAAMEYFKFAMIEALSPLIIYFTQLMVGVMDFISAHPKLMEVVGLIVGVLAAVGTFMYVGSQIALFLGALKMAGVSAELKAAIGTGGWLSALVAGGLMIGVGLYIATTANDFQTVLISTVITAIGIYAVAKVFTLSGGTVAIAAVGIAVVLELIYAPFFKTFRDQLAEARDKFVKWADDLGADLYNAFWEWMSKLPIIGGFFKNFERIKTSSDDLKGSLELLSTDTSLTLSKPGESWNTTVTSITESQGPLESFFSWLGEWASLKHALITDSMKGEGGVIPAYKDFENQTNTTSANYTTALNAMSDSTTLAVTKICSQLDLIPRNITTTHTIVESTVTQSPTYPSTWNVPTFTNPFRDFIWRAGYGPVSIDSSDTLMGVKDGNGTTTNAGITLNNTYNISGVSDVDALKRLMEEHDRQLMSNISRIKIPGV